MAFEAFGIPNPDPSQIERGLQTDLGIIAPDDEGLGTEFVKGAATGIRNLAQSVTATLGQVTGSETVQDAAEDMQATTQLYRQSLKPAAGTLNKAVNTMGQFVEDVPGLAASFIGGFGGASLAAKLGTGIVASRKIATAGQVAGLASSVFMRGFGNRKLELQDRGVEEPWAVVGALLSVAAEASVERIGMEGVFGKLGSSRVFKRMGLAAAAGSEAGGLGATALSTLTRALYNPTSYAKYSTRVGVAVGSEILEELATLFTDAAIDGMLGAEGAGLPSGEDMRETIYQTFFRTLPIALTGGLLSGGRNDIAAKEIEARVTAPVTDETRAAAYTKAADREGAPEEIALKARQNMAEMDNQMAAFEGVMATRFTPADAKETTRLARVMAENLAALDDNILPTDLLAQFKLAFETGQVDQKRWNDASAIKDPEAQHAARVALVKEVLGDTYYDITDLAWARQKKADNDRREVELFGDEKPEALAKRIAITTAFEQPVTRVLAQDVVDRDTYKRIFARGSVSGVKAGGGTYTVVARGTYTDESGKTRLVRPGDLVFTQEAAPAKGKKAKAVAGVVEMPTKEGETARSIMLDRAAAMDGGEFYDSMKRLIQDGVAPMDLDDVRAEAMALVYPDETAAERARIEAEDAAVIAQMEAEDAAFVRGEITGETEAAAGQARINRFKQRYAGVQAPAAPAATAPAATAPAVTPIKTLEDMATAWDETPVGRQAGLDEAAAYKEEQARKAERLKRFKERYAGITVTPTTQVGQDTKTGKPHTIKDFDELARRLAPLEKKPAEVPETPAPMKRDAAGLADLAKRTGIPENIVAALAKDVQMEMLSNEDYAQQVSAELLPRIQMQTAMQMRAVETAGQRARTAKLNAFAQEITDRELARETAVQARALRKTKRPKARGQAERDARAEAAAPDRAARQWTAAELKLVEGMAEGRFSAGETTPFAFYDPKTKIAHFFANAKSTDVVHELFHHMTMTGIMPSWHLEALKRNYGLDTPDGDEAAVEGFLRYLRTKELPEGADPKLKDAFNHMRQVFAATMQPLAGQLNNETLAVFDTLFGFEPSGEVAEAAAALQARVLHTAEIEGGDTLSKRAEAPVEESLPTEESGRMSAREAKELFRAGMSPDDFEGRAPRVDWNGSDNYGVWTRKSVKEFIKAEHDFIYPAMLNKYDLTPRLVEEESAADIRKMSEKEFQEAYPDEFLNEDPDDPDTAVDWREARDRIAQEELSSWEEGGRQEMSTQFTAGYPPVVVRRTGEDSFVVEDGNHRVSVWQDADKIDVVPAWVVDDYLWKASEESGRFSARAVDRLGFYSAAERAVEGLKQETFTPAQLKSVVAKTPGVKAQELEDTGFNDWLDGVDGKVTKAQALAFLENNGPRLTEVVKGAPMSETEFVGQYSNPTFDEMSENAQEVIRRRYREESRNSGTKFGQLQLPGATNYREALLTLSSEGRVLSPQERSAEVSNALRNFGPQSPQYRNALARQEQDNKEFRSPHWNEPNVLAHVRLNDRIGPDGEKILFVEEIQSDALQKLRALQEKLAKGETLTAAEQQEYKTLSNFPFKGSKSWAMLAFKRVLRMAAEQGYDSVAWTDGITQIGRYEDATRQQVDSIKWSRMETSDAGTQYIIKAFKDGRQTYTEMMDAPKVSETLGKAMAEKITSSGESSGTLEGSDLTVGGEGMKGFYDRILPSEVGKYVGKIDKAAVVGQTTLGLSGEYNLDGMYNQAREAIARQATLTPEIEAHFDAFIESNGRDDAAVEGINDALADIGEERIMERNTGKDTQVWSLPITDALRSSVMEGQGRFSARAISEAPADDDKAYSKSRQRLVATHIARMQLPAADALNHLRSLAAKRYPHVAQGDPEKTLRLLSKQEWQEFYTEVRKAQETERAARLDRRAIAEFGGNMATLTPAERTLVASLDYAKTQSLFRKPSLRNPTKEAIEAVAADLASKMEQEVELKENARMASVAAHHGPEGAGTVQNLLRSFWHSAKKFRRGVFNRVLLQTRDIQTLALLLADNNPESTFMQLSADIRETDNRKVAQTAKSLGYLEAAMKKRGVDSFARHMARPVVVGGQAMSFEEALAIAMFARGDTSKTETGEYSYRQADALFQSNGRDYVGERGRDAFDVFITDAWKVVNADKNVKATMEVMDEYFEMIKKDIDASRAERGEAPMGDQSGYFPMIREGGMFANEDPFADTIRISPAKLDPKVPVDARTRERGQAYGGRLRMSVETVFNEYRRQADQYIAKETTVQMWKAALDQARTAFADKGLTDELEMVYSHLESERHYTGRYTPLSADEIVVRAVSSKYKQSIFGLNIPSAMMQPLGALNVNSMLPIMDAWRAPLNIMDMMRHAAFNIGRNFPNVLKGNKYWDMMVAGNSKHSASEFTAIETGIQKGAAGYFDPAIKGVPLKDVLLLPMRHGDMIGRAAAWGAAYESQMRQMRNTPSLTEKQKHDRAFKFAEDAVEETQAAGMMSGRTWMQKSNEYLKAIVPFTSQQSKDWNILATRLLNPMQKAWKAGEARGGKMAALNEVWEVIAGTEHARREYGIHRGAGQVLAFSFVVPAMAMAALSRGRPPEDFEEFLADLLAYNVAIVPIIGPAIRTAIVMDRFFDQQPIYFKLVNEAAKAVKAAKEKDGEEFTWTAVRSAAMATGLPLKAVKVFEKGFKGQFTDQYDELDMRKVMIYSLLGHEALVEAEAEGEGAR